MRKIILSSMFLITIVSSKAQDANNIIVDDTRDLNNQPSYYQRQARFEFKRRDVLGLPGLGYSGLLTFAPWGDASGNKNHQLSFNDDGIFYRMGAHGDVWGSWNQLWHSGNFNPASYFKFGTQPGIVMNGGNALEAGNYNGYTYIQSHDNNPLSLNPIGNTVIIPVANVGIGTATPTEKLSVNGNIRSKKVIVTQTGWPDYVFDSSYQLPTLDSVSTFIQANKHLPDMPSAATVEKDGHDLGEVQKQLLKKVEELTLYVIEQQKQIAEVKGDNERLKKELIQIRKIKK